ncbi:hypothetical protein H7R52_03855 [Weissella confusa]|uniref:Uncharacterized protein n=1 Tax=Weissella confusa TaxID=1583 RepID=A0A923NHD0_WEICO|nr:hypothetical protein [Weissella confusa]
MSKISTTDINIPPSENECNTFLNKKRFFHDGDKFIGMDKKKTARSNDLAAMGWADRGSNPGPTD